MNVFEISNVIRSMTNAELDKLCETLFKADPKTAEVISRDLEIRAMDKAIVEAELKGELYD